MGRHSIPDPDDAGEQTGNGPDAGHGSEPAGDVSSGSGDFAYGAGDYGQDDYPADAYGRDEYGADEYGADEYGAEDYRYETDGGYDEPDPAPRGFPAVADEDQPTQAFSVTGRQRTYESGE